MIRCMHCMLWCHLKCVVEPNDYSGVWTCLDCRQFPRLLNALVADVEDITSQLRLLNHTVSDIGNNSSSVKDIVTAVRNAVCALKLQVTDLQNENACLKSRLQISVVDKKSAGTVVSSLLIGSSVIWNIQSVSPSDLEINSISGLQFSQVKEKLDDLQNNGKKYGSVIIVVGSKDSQQQDATTESITQAAHDAVESALKIANKVTLSSILPRTDDDSAQLKSENVNLSLKNMCNQYDHVTFSDQDGAFRLSDESVNDALLLGDGLHPNYKGTQKLINTLKINATVRRYQKPASHQNNWYTNGYNSSSSRPPLLSIPARPKQQQWNQSTISCTNCRQLGHDVLAQLNCFATDVTLWATDKRTVVHDGN